jgi:hypothetical protein
MPIDSENQSTTSEVITQIPAVDPGQASINNPETKITMNENRSDDHNASLNEIGEIKGQPDLYNNIDSLMSGHNSLPAAPPTADNKNEITENEIGEIKGQPDLYNNIDSLMSGHNSLPAELPTADNKNEITDYKMAAVVPGSDDITHEEVSTRIAGNLIRHSALFSGPVTVPSSHEAKAEATSTLDDVSPSPR